MDISGVINNTRVHTHTHRKKNLIYPTLQVYKLILSIYIIQNNGAFLLNIQIKPEDMTEKIMPSEQWGGFKKVRYKKTKQKTTI